MPKDGKSSHPMEEFRRLEKKRARERSRNQAAAHEPRPVKQSRMNASDPDQLRLDIERLEHQRRTSELSRQDMLRLRSLKEAWNVAKTKGGTQTKPISARALTSKRDRTASREGWKEDDEEKPSAVLDPLNPEFGFESRAESMKRLGKRRGESSSEVDAAEPSTTKMTEENPDFIPVVGPQLPSMGVERGKPQHEAPRFIPTALLRPGSSTTPATRPRPKPHSKPEDPEQEEALEGFLNEIDAME